MSVSLTFLSEKVSSSQNTPTLPLHDLQFWWYGEVLTPPFFPSSEIQTESSGVHPSPERTGNFVTDQSYRVSHCGVCGACVVLNVQDLLILDSRGKSLTFQTPGDVDANHHHHQHHPPLCSGANITQKAIWRWRKDESIDCLGWLTHEQPLEGKHILLHSVVELHSLIYQGFSVPSWRGTIIEVG